MKLTPLAASAALVLSGCTPNSVEATHPGPSERLRAATAIEEKYIKELGCAVTDVAITIEDGLASEFDGGVSPAESDRGVIEIDSRFAEKVDDKTFEMTAAHELAHACAGKRRNFEIRYTLSKGEAVIGANGFTLFISYQDGKVNPFHPIEEGVAEYLSSKLTGNVNTALSLPYQAVRELTKEIATQSQITPEQLASYLNNSDFVGFVAQVYGLGSRDEVTSNHIEEIMTAYNNAYLQIPN